ncbi:MAG: sigma-70 family RNA polymerase sigma factor [Acidimicrobiales bacterium]
MDDAALVEAARGGDGTAWAGIYDRYADKLHDHCHRILRDRDEAADALHDAFIAASRNLHQLRDPARLRPWLYSICRHEALRRARQRSRVDLTDEVDDMTGVEVDLDRGSRTEELQELVWAAAAGLSPRDQALLDLNLRQGLEGQDLADAMGTSLNNSYVMLSRLRDQVERSLGALLIARLGRDDCTELDSILDGWDGRFSPLLRKRVARHVDRCDVCSERRAAVVSPLALLGAMPLVPAPEGLRTRVLEGIRGGATTDGSELVRFTREGFAVGERRTRPVGGRAWWAAAGIVVVVGLVLALLVGPGDDQPTELLATGDTTSTTTAAPSAPPSSQTPQISVSIDPATTTIPPEAPPTTTADGAPSTTEPQVAPPPPTGPADTTPPVIVSVTQTGSFISCEVQPTFDVVARVTGADSVVLTWQGVSPAGPRLMERSGDTWTATLGPFVSGTGGPTTFTVVAVDAAGNEVREPRPFTFAPCPG